jgi:hypothetical protein
MDHDQPQDHWPGLDLVRHEQRSAVQVAVGRLPEVQRRVVVLRFGREWSVRQVADELAKSEAAVKQLTYRAVNRLRELLRRPGMSTMPESDDLPGLREAVLEEVRLEPDPGFAADLRGELRGLQARATRNLRWFDLELPIGPIRIVHDEQLVHLVDNDFRRYEYRAEYELGFEPAYGESERVRKAAEQVLAGRRWQRNAFLGELTPFQRAVLR